jgi:hypothetical protein
MILSAYEHDIFWRVHSVIYISVKGLNESTKIRKKKNTGHISNNTLSSLQGLVELTAKVRAHGLGAHPSVFSGAVPAPVFPISVSFSLSRQSEKDGDIGGPCDSGWGIESRPGLRVRDEVKLARQVCSCMATPDRRSAQNRTSIVTP